MNKRNGTFVYPCFFLKKVAISSLTDFLFQFSDCIRMLPDYARGQFLIIMIANHLKPNVIESININIDLIYRTHINTQKCIIFILLDFAVVVFVRLFSDLFFICLICSAYMYIGSKSFHSYQCCLLFLCSTHSAF